MHKKYIANKAFLVDLQGKILFVRDSGGEDHANAVGKWDVPGGRMNQGEHPLDALAREVLEETGVRIDTRLARPFHVDLWGVGGDIRNEPIVGVFYAVQIDEQQVRLSDEHNELCWHDPRQEAPEPLNDSVRRALESYRNLEGIVTAADEAIKGREGFGLVQVFTGNGKGKTTAALGEALRAHAVGKRVAFVYFDKGGTHYSERKILDQLGLVYVATGRDRIDPVTGRFDFSVQDIDKQEAARGLEEARRFVREGYDVVVLDEVNSSVSLGMLAEQDVIHLIDSKPDKTELVLTGRGAPESFLQKAHLVTEMRLRKHYFYSGVPAREGLDF